MKANELMIGDWVHVLPISIKVEPHDSIIGALTRNPNDTISIEGFYKGHFGWSVSEDDIEPIPLTEDMLKINGIKYQFGQPWYQAYNPLTLEGVFEIVYDDMIRLPIRYVHELQHALRLCGLHDLADNFKLK